MFRLLFLYFITLLVGCNSNRECFIFENAEVALLTGDGIKNVRIHSENQELGGAYKVMLVNQNIPTLCEHAIANLHKLESVVIDNSGVKRISPNAFDNLPSLRDLTVVNNNIDKIERGVFSNLLVRKLNLSSNEISRIQPNAFENMMNLEVLDLHSNKLKTFENDWFQYTPKLYRLDFMYNIITALPENAFVNIIKKKQKKHDLELWFTHNAISSIDKKAFNKIEKIESLWLSHNLLSTIDVEVFAQVQHIQTLDLDNNQFTCFDDKFLKHLNAKELDIDGNPIDCECLKKIKALEKEKDMQIQHLRIGLQCVLSKLQKLKNNE